MGRKNNRGGHKQTKPKYKSKKSKTRFVTLADMYDEASGEYKRPKYEPAPLQSKPSGKLHGRRKSSPR